MIEVNNLIKRYGRIQAVKGISLIARPGEVLGLLGPNGAGKSTTIKAITGIIRPTSGTIKLAGFDIATQDLQAKSNLGYVPDRPYLYPKLTGREILRVMCRLREVEDADKKAQKWLEFFSLQDFGNEMIETYSHGMRQKLVFILALIHEPAVLVVDEPMVGLDPKAAKQVRELMADYARKGKTVLLTTHSMEVAQAVAHKVILVNKGQIAAQGDMAALRSQVGNQNADLESIFLCLTEEEAKDKELVLS